MVGRRAGRPSRSQARAAHRSRSQASVLSACRRTARDHTCRAQQVRLAGCVFARDLIASHGGNYTMPNLLDHLAAPNCSRLGSSWDRCRVHYVEPRDSSDELRPTERTNDPCSTSVVSVAALYGPPKPIAPIDPVLGISLVGHSRDVIRLFSRAAVGFPIGARLKSKTPHEGAGFIEGAPIAATTTATSKPVAPTVPPGIGINGLGTRRNIVGPLS